MSTALATVRAQPDKYEKDFDTVVTFLTQYINKRGLIPSVKVVSIAQTSLAKWQKTIATCDTFKRMTTAQHHLLYKLWQKAGLFKGMKTPESSKALETRVTVLEANRKQ